MSELSAQQQLDALQSRERNLLEEVASQRDLITRLNTALQALTRRIENGDNQDGDEDTLMEDENNAIATWDTNDNVYRCSDCGWEVVDEQCQGCTNDFEMEEVDEEDEVQDPHKSLSTESMAFAQERIVASLNDTLTLDVGPDTFIPSEYDRRDEYRTLIARGATPLMCDTFHLRFSHANGITATADAYMYKTFAGLAMEVGDVWLIRLGRSITLEKDDVDGSDFMHDLIEDVIHFGRQGHLQRDIMWETLLLREGVWVTQPHPRRNSEHDDDDKDSDSGISRNENDRDDSEGDNVFEGSPEKIPGNIHGHRHNVRIYDATLVHPNRPQNYPLLYEDDYDTEDDEENTDDEDEKEEVDPDWATQAGVPDAIFGSDDEYDDSYNESESEEVDGVSEQNNLEQSGKDEGDESSQSDSDAAGSDWDSDEELSGDEIFFRKDRSPPN